MHIHGALLQTKLTKPQLGLLLVPRPALVERMNEALGLHLTLLSAPAGFGKTTLALEWLASLGSPALFAAWLTVDEYDNHPARFWSYVVGAIRISLGPTSPLADVLTELQTGLAGGDPPLLEAALASLLNALVDLEGSVVLVLDDYHLIHLQAVHESLHYFIMHLPVHVHVVILTRADPSLPLNRLRSQNQLLELRARDLSFTPAEVGALLSRRIKLALPTELTAALTQQTEGWPAGVHLLALSLQGRSLTHARQLAHSFAGSNRYVLDYLLEEVLRGQPQAVQRFLLRTSILSRLSPALCDAVMGVKEAGEESSQENVGVSQAHLAYLEAHNLFLIPLDEAGRWHRYYHLFAEALRNELERQEPEIVAQLHKRASLWCAEHDLPFDAIDHALRAGEWSGAAALIASRVRAAMLSGDFVRLNRWLTALPADVISAHPRLAVGHAWMLLFRGPLPDVEQVLEVAAGALSAIGERDEPTLRAEIAALRAVLESFRWNVRATLEASFEGERLLVEDDYFDRAAIAHALGRAYHFGGELAQAIEQYTAAIAACHQLGSHFMTLFPLFRLAHTYAARGDLHAALRCYRRGLHQAAVHGGEQWLITADALIGLADIMCEQNDLNGAEHHVRRGITFAQQRGVESLVVGLTVQARVLLALGRTGEASQTLALAAERCQTYNNVHMTQWLAAHQARLDLALGDVDAARQWADTWAGPGQDDGYLPEFEELTRVRVYLAQRRWRAALALLRSWEHQAETAARQRSLIEILVLQAEALWEQGEAKLACAALQRALMLAEPQEALRVFLDEGARLTSVLERLPGDSPYARRVLDVLRAELAERQGHSNDPNVLVEPLTPRELEILRLIARGASNQQIADAFVLTVGTVKGHVNHILSKLAARNRTEAVARGRELGVL